VHEGSPDAVPLSLGRHRHAVEPAAVSVVARQRRPDDRAVDGGDQEQLALPPQAAREDRLGRTPARVVVEDASPERRHGGGVVGVELADTKRRH
jgi:hypothetical protein